MKRQLFWFGVVGVSAMLVHLATVALVLVPLGVPPLLANCAGFLVAFQVSHAGHRRFTFQDGRESASLSSASTSRLRFFGVALASFGINELLYALLLRYTTLDYRLALALVLVLVAALTFVLARNWAFASREIA
jgi:putative flippase GtrA